MGRTAASYLAGGALAATASLAIAVAPVLAADPTSTRGFGAVRAEPSGDTGVTFEVLPATPTPTPTRTPPTPTPTTPQPTPSHGELPVTGSDGSPLVLVGLGGALVFVGWLAARRRRQA